MSFEKPAINRTDSFGPDAYQNESSPSIGTEIRDPYLPIPVISSQLTLSGQFRKLALAALVSFLPLSEAQSQEKTTSPEDRMVAVEVMGEALVAQTESLGFVIDVQLEAQPGESYVVHVGQVHTHPGDMAGRLMTDVIVKSFQQGLTEIAIPLAEVGSGVIFDEGLSLNQVELEEDRNSIIKFKEQFDQISISSLKTFDDIQKAFKLIRLYQRFTTNTFIANYIDPETVKVLMEKVTTAVKLFPEDDVENIEKKQLLEVDLGLLSIGAFVDLASMSGVSGQDGFASLFIEGKLKLAATEDGALNGRAIAAMKKKNSIEHAYKKNLYSVLDHIKATPIWDDFENYNELAKERSLSTEELFAQTELQKQFQMMFNQHEAALKQTPIGQAYLDAEREFDRLAMVEREAVVFKKIAEYEGQNGVEFRHVVVRYGDNHNFTNALRQFNATNEGPDRGLIKLHANY